MLDSLASRQMVFIIKDPLCRNPIKKQHVETIVHFTNQILREQWSGDGSVS